MHVLMLFNKYYMTDTSSSNIWCQPISNDQSNSDVDNGPNPYCNSNHMKDINCTGLCICRAPNTDINTAMYTTKACEITFGTHACHRWSTAPNYTHYQPLLT